MNNKRFSVLLIAIMFIFAGSRMVHADDGNLDDVTKARIAKAEQGPSTIDVSKYPKKVQDIYTEDFSQKCMMCHSLSRSFNSNFVLPSELENYVKRMRRMPGSSITEGDASKIIDFLIYDSSVRKKVLLDDKLAKATPEERAAAEAKIKKIHDKYDY